MASLFISYAHADKAWFDRFVDHLTPLVRQEEFVVWSDRELETGDVWHDELQEQLRAAKVAVLLISRAFLKSEYIANSELPVLLTRAHDEGLKILPVLLSPSMFEHVRYKWGAEEQKLSSLQAANSPSETLSELSDSQADRILIRVAEQILDIMHKPDPIRRTANFELHHLRKASNILVGRDEELARLDEAWTTAGQHVITVVARGGAGKTALVAQWLNRVKDADRVFGWSFYSQGTNNKAATADPFVDQALRFFGEANPESIKSPHARGERLAELVGAGRNLLILDGLEPLQYPPGAMEGRLKDPGLQTLVAALSAHNKGLCVITTREVLPELAGDPAIELPPLSAEAGAELLAILRVNGSVEERAALSTRLGGHALSVQLAGTYIAEVLDGEIGRAQEIDLTGDPHARHVLESYERWLSGTLLSDKDASTSRRAEIAGTGARMLAVLRILGLFDRPVEMWLIDVLRAEPAIPGLTEPLIGLSPEEWNRTIARLRRLELLTEDSDTGVTAMLDAHPLVREFFAAQLDKLFADASREAHARIYQRLATSTAELPDTLHEMMPLYHAVFHGCKAGLYQEALDDVYWKRIQRGSGFASQILGAAGANLLALSSFFTGQWRGITENLVPDDRNFVVSEVGSELVGMGRIREGLELATSALRAYKADGEWEKAAVVAGNISTFYLTLGQVGAAVRHGAESIEMADRSQVARQRIHARAIFAVSLHSAGARLEARMAYDDAHVIPTDDELTFGLHNYRLCDLLLDESEPVSLQTLEDVNRRAKENLQIVEPHEWLLAIGLEHLTLGRSSLMAIPFSVEPDSKHAHLIEAGRHLEKGVQYVRRATALYYLPLLLIHRATLWRTHYALAPTSANDYLALAEKDLNEAERIAEPGGMLRWLIESAVERCRMYIAANKKQKAQEQLDRAKNLVMQSESPYDPHVPGWDEWKPPPYVDLFKEGQIVGYCRCHDAISKLEVALL